MYAFAIVITMAIDLMKEAQKGKKLRKKPDRSLAQRRRGLLIGHAFMKADSDKESGSADALVGGTAQSRSTNAISAHRLKT